MKQRYGAVKNRKRKSRSEKETVNQNLDGEKQTHDLQKGNLVDIEVKSEHQIYYFFANRCTSASRIYVMEIGSLNEMAWIDVARKIEQRHRLFHTYKRLRHQVQSCHKKVDGKKVSTKQIRERQSVMGCVVGDTAITQKYNNSTEMLAQLCQQMQTLASSLPPLEDGAMVRRGDILMIKRVPFVVRTHFNDVMHQAWLFASMHQFCAQQQRTESDSLLGTRLAESLQATQSTYNLQERVCEQTLLALLDPVVRKNAQLCRIIRQKRKRDQSPELRKQFTRCHEQAQHMLQNLALLRQRCSYCEQYTWSIGSLLKRHVEKLLRNMPIDVNRHSRLLSQIVSTNTREKASFKCQYLHVPQTMRHLVRDVDHNYESRFLAEMERLETEAQQAAANGNLAHKYLWPTKETDKSLQKVKNEQICEKEICEPKTKRRKLTSVGDEARKIAQLTEDALQHSHLAKNRVDVASDSRATNFREYCLACDLTDHARDYCPRIAFFKQLCEEFGCLKKRFFSFESGIFLDQHSSLFQYFCPQKFDDGVLAKERRKKLSLDNALLDYIRSGSDLAITDIRYLS